jgi:hypothetical protein
MSFSESEAKKGEREADAERRSGELLGEKDEPDLAEQVEGPPDRPRDQQGRQDPLN